MDKQRVRQLYELFNRLNKVDVNTLSEEQIQYRSSMIAKLKEEVKTIKEFAPDAGDGGEEETLHKYARMWYNGDLATQQRVEQALARMGWEIGELESEEGGAFVIRTGDEHGDSYISFAVDDLTEGWKSKLAGVALAGAAALGGMGHAQAADLSHFNTQYLQQVVQGNHPRPMVSVDDAKAELQARANGKQQATAPARVDSPSGPQGFSKEYLQKASDPNRFGRYLISVEKAQELLKQMGESVTEEFNGEYDDEAGMAKSNLHTMARAVNGLLDTIEDNDNLPEWAQEKLAKAEMMTTSVWDYLLSQKEQGMDPKITEASQRVDSLVTDALKIMRGSEVSDAVLALKRVLGDRAYNERRGFYSFYVDQIHDMYGQQGVAEGLPQTLRKVVPGYAKREIDKKMDAGKFGKTDADKDANFQRYKKIQDKIKEQGVAEGSVTPNITVNKVHDDGHEKEWHIHRGKEMIGYVIKNQPDTAEGLYIAYGHGPGRAFVEEFAGLKPAVNYITSLKEGVAEAKKPSPKLKPVTMKKTDPVSEEINTEAYERLQKVFAFKNYEG